MGRLSLPAYRPRAISSSSLRLMIRTWRDLTSTTCTRSVQEKQGPCSRG